MGLFNNLFSREVSVHDDKIGELTTKIKGDDSSANYLWAGKHQLKGQSKPTSFVLEGNNAGPHNIQLQSAYRIVDTLENIIAQVDQSLKTQTDLKPVFKGDWTKEFYLSSVSLYAPNDEQKQFEIAFESLNEDDAPIISAVWNDGRLSEIKAS